LKLDIRYFAGIYGAKMEILSTHNLLRGAGD